ncbi:ATP-dependent helicase [Natronobiforma cellulositropha]|uniref:ATP-dependent helicase n=1 Tax=Natronobiforma cellulositropha TaxID=1679076 RepID=UPI0021D60899|nr:ATP-dependent DNA helicase [Natronobiforma cellulositropha]
MGDQHASAGGRSNDDAPETLTPHRSQRAVIESDAACISVDAGAGTGKTTTMLMRIEHCIEHRGVDPDDILVLTFANEAAASIREAVSTRLDPEAAAAIDVYTYHSFCYHLVREYAYYLGLSPEFDVLTEHGRSRLVRRLLAETDYGFVDAARGHETVDDLARSVDRFVAHVSRENVDPATLDERLPDVATLESLGEFVLWLERVADENLTFDNEALRFFNREEHDDAAREALVGYGKLLTYCREQVAAHPDAFRADPVVADVDRYFGVLQDCVTATIETLSLEEPATKQLPRALFANQLWGAKTNRLEQTPFGRLTHYVEFLRSARHYADVYADYRATLEREGALDFDELVRTATRLLAADSPVAPEITGRWRQVYCDEFQDTDETQFSLITRLCAGEDRPTLLAIGDKDQSIYGWRGTDRDGLDRLATVFDDHERIALELNFRSKQEILDVTNCCSYGSQSSKTLREVDREPGTHDEDEPPHRVATVESAALERSTPDQVASTVSRLLTGHLEGIPARTLEDVAVIVRTNEQARAVSAALRDRQLPHEVSGSARGDRSPGMRTVLSYLHVLVDPGADVHLRRVLTYRYRVTEGDLARLHARDGSLFDAVTVGDFETLGIRDRGRLERARAHLETLETARATYPLAHFFRRFRETTRIEWYLTSDERLELERLERFVDAYDAEDVLGSLTPAFVEAARRTLEGGASAYGQGSRSPDRIDVMTVHQAKGLQFDTVLVPYLSDEQWCVERDYARRSRYRFLAAMLDDAVDSPLCADLAADTVAEEWRVLHVALTRAQNHLVLFGSHYDYEGERAEGELGVSLADACLPDAIEWSTAGERMDLWEALSASVAQVRERYPETVADYTAALDEPDATPGTITYWAGDGERTDPLETREAIETVHRLGRLLRTDALRAVGDAVSWGDAAGEGVETPTGRSLRSLTDETVRFPVETLSSASALPVATVHSYTSMRTYESCPRKHYLDHVVRAPPDPTAVDASDAATTDARVVGSVFHAVAAEAFYRGKHSRDAWRALARRHLLARDLDSHRPAVLACIDRYFEATAPGIDTPLAAWETLAAEVPFSLPVEGVDGHVVGSVDTIRRTPAGDLVLLDYKTTATRIAPEAATQLRLYLRACERLLEEPIDRVGYVYVGDAGDDGERVDCFDAADLPPFERVRETLAAVDDPSFDETAPGEHCRFCAHRSLGCAPDAYASPSLETDDD